MTENSCLLVDDLLNKTFLLKSQSLSLKPCLFELILLLSREFIGITIVPLKFISLLL